MKLSISVVWAKVKQFIVNSRYAYAPLTITTDIDHHMVTQLGGSSHQPLGTDEVIPLEDGRARLCHIN